MIVRNLDLSGWISDDTKKIDILSRSLDASTIFVSGGTTGHIQPGRRSITDRFTGGRDHDAISEDQPSYFQQAVNNQQQQRQYQSKFHHALSMYLFMQERFSFHKINSENASLKEYEFSIF
jgi:hypothetical protein